MKSFFKAFFFFPVRKHFLNESIDRLQPASRGQCRCFEVPSEALICHQVILLRGFPGHRDELQQKVDGSEPRR